MFGIGIIELALVALALVAMLVMLLFRSCGLRWPAATFFGLVLATLITPADPLSTLVVAALCMVFFAAGTSMTAMSPGKQQQPLKTE